MIDCLVRVVTSIDRLIYGRYFVRSIFFAAHNSYDESDIFDLKYCIVISCVPFCIGRFGMTYDLLNK